MPERLRTGAVNGAGAGQTFEDKSIGVLSKGGIDLFVVEVNMGLDVTEGIQKELQAHLGALEDGDGHRSGEWILR